MTAENFRNHQGFDLVNFGNHQYPLSEVPSYKILKSDTCGAFKANISQRFNVLPEQIRFWVFVNRQNKTIRPHELILEAYDNTS